MKFSLVMLALAAFRPDKILGNDTVICSDVKTKVGPMNTNGGDISYSVNVTDSFNRQTSKLSIIQKPGDCQTAVISTTMGNATITFYWTGAVRYVGAFLTGTTGYTQGNFTEQGDFPPDEIVLQPLFNPENVTVSVAAAGSSNGASANRVWSLFCILGSVLIMCK
mmetsp:Transcript_20386/g.44250  ORF Transcript_20386/g.44250 Transcript_20386/m.44250 type:complete len:165 (-) Transcript_20386:1711-2205(-)